MTTNARRVSRSLAAVLIVTVVGALAYLNIAEARSLGSLTASQIGTTSNVVAPCQTSGSIALTWGTKTYNAGASPYYSATTLNASALNAACYGKLYKLVVANSSGTSLATAAGTLPGTPTATFTLSAAVSLTVARQTTLVIYG